jgi:RING-like zinc finger
MSPFVFQIHPPTSMSSRRSSGQAPALRRETTSVGQPRGEEFITRAGGKPGTLVATSASSTQIKFDADARCVLCLESYKENENVWQVLPCEHIFHCNCVDEASISILGDSTKLIQEVVVQKVRDLSSMSRKHCYWVASHGQHLEFLLGASSHQTLGECCIHPPSSACCENVLPESEQTALYDFQGLKISLCSFDSCS